MTRPFRFALLSLLLGLLLWASPAAAQVNVSADLMSRYVWRGFDFGESFSIQPDLSYTNGGFTVGTWASYSIAADGSGANEHDLYVGYAIGPVSVGLTDYYFPSPVGVEGVPDGAKFFNYDNEGAGAHYLEPSLSVTGPASFPVTVTGAIVAYNAPDNPVYLEAAVPFTVEGVEMGVAAGGVIVSPDDGAVDDFYGLPESAFTKVGLSATKAIPITDTFELPISAQFIVNPYTERTFLVFGVSLSP